MLNAHTYTCLLYFVKYTVLICSIGLIYNYCNPKAHAPRVNVNDRNCVKCLTEHGAYNGHSGLTCVCNLATRLK